MAEPSPYADAERIVEEMCRSIALAGSGKPLEALACLDTGVRLNPTFLPCRLARAQALRRLGRFDQALADLAYVLRLAPLPHVADDYTATLVEGKAQLEARLAQDAQDAEAYLQRGNLYLQTGDAGAALQDYDAARILPTAPEAVPLLRGNALYALCRWEESVAAYDAVLAQDEGDALTWFNRGNALQMLGQWSAAIASYRRARSVESDFAEAWLEEAHCLLSRGEFGAGWPLYEWRWQTAQLCAARLSSPQPRWLGDQLAGQTILLWAEQGLGDSIQFARFVPRVAELAGQVVLRLPQPLRRLLATLDTRVRVIGDDVPLPPHAAHCPLLSLPLALGEVAGMPTGRPYLHADASLSRAWARRLAASPGPRVGLVWAGRRHSLLGPGNVRRDLPLKAWQPLVALDVQIFCLQPDLTPDETAVLSGLPNVHCLGGQLVDLAETAALIDNLDLVISVDTAIAHLAGALGKPCWLLLRHAAEWRWQRSGTQSPWYASVKIFRQAVEGDWDTVVARVGAALAAGWDRRTPTAENA